MRKVLFLLLVLVMTGSLAFPAPAPFPRRAKSLRWDRDALVGTWQVRWGEAPGVLCKITFREDGYYECAWVSSMVYWGTWGIRGDTLFISETCQPCYHLPDFTTYEIKKAAQGGQYGLGERKIPITLQLLEKK